MDESPTNTSTPQDHGNRLRTNEFATQRQQSPFRHIQHRKKRRYLKALVETGGNVTRACELAGVDRSTPYTPQWRGDPVLAKALEQAREMAIDALEAEVIRRGFEGVEEPVGWYKGQPGGYVRKYSDVLLIFKLKAAKPDVYADRMEFRGSLANLDMSKLPDEAIARIAGGENIMSVLASLAGRLPAGLLAEGEAEPIEED
jgi:hypothetical protein